MNEDFSKEFNATEFTQSLEGKTNATIQSELDDLIIEEKRLDLEIKREQVAKIKAYRQQALDNARSRALATKQFLAQREAIQAHCNHRKGGQGARAVVAGEGDSPSYAIIKHTLPAGGILVLCTRCLKEWHPADRYNVEGGRIVPKPATPGWEQAVQWNTDNSPSGSSRFFFEKTETRA